MRSLPAWKVPSRRHNLLPRCLQAALTLSLLAGVAGVGSAALHAQPIIEYRFDDKAAFAAGNIANARNVLYSGTLSGTRSQVRGALGNGVDFDGTTGAMTTTGTTGLNFGSGITVEAFVRRDANAGEDAVVSKWYGGDQFLLTFYSAGNGQLVFNVKSAGGAYGSVTYNVPDTTYLGEWVHVAGTYDGAGNFRLYWNGALAASSFVSVTGMATGSNPIRVGDANNSWSRFDGGIDEVKVWNRALVASELSRPLRPRVLIVEYDSADPTYNNPHTITTNLTNDIANSSNYVKYELTQWIDTGVMPPQRAGGGFDYALLFSTYDVCGKVKRGDIHEVWVWAGPDGGMLEWAVNGPWREAYGLGVGMPSCDAQVVTMGYNYERLLPEAEHSFGHRMENLHQFWWGTALWDRFDGQRGRYAFGDPSQPPLVTTGAHCGNVHFPPNADHHYEYSATDVVSSNCANWRSDGTGTFTNVTCTAWGCSEDGFLRWWMAAMPGPVNSHGPSGTRIQNWWTVVSQ